MRVLHQDVTMLHQDVRMLHQDARMLLHDATVKVPLQDVRMLSLDARGPLLTDLAHAFHLPQMASEGGNSDRGES